MAVLLNRAYEGYLAGTVVNLPTNVETALVAQGLASASTRALTTTGAVTANVMQGTCAVAAASGASIVITNNKVDANSIVVAYVSQATADGTWLRVERVVPAAGSFTIYGTAAATATTLISWAVLSPSIGAYPLS